jgi:hypothetical protein
VGVDAGADGIIVSNHGGRQLDYAPASLDALPGIVAAVGKRVPVLMDGGVRRGTDIIKVSALSPHVYSTCVRVVARLQNIYSPCTGTGKCGADGPAYSRRTCMASSAVSAAHSPQLFSC